MLAVLMANKRIHYGISYPQNGDRIVTIDPVTSLQPMYCHVGRDRSVCFAADDTDGYCDVCSGGRVGGGDRPATVDLHHCNRRCRHHLHHSGININIIVIIKGGSVAEWLARWTQAH